MLAQARPTGIATSGAAPANVSGEAVALTVFSTVRRWGLLELPLFFFALRKSRKSLTTLKRLSFIQSARWSLLREIPYNGAPQPRVSLRHPHLYFESNFNGGWEEYIDAFSFLLTSGMFGFWGSSYGFPWALPTGPFKAYIRRNEYVASHYYSAYPEATATIVLQALELEPTITTLCERAADLSPAEFAAEWRRAVTEVQQCL